MGLASCILLDIEKGPTPVWKLYELLFGQGDYVYSVEVQFTCILDVSR